MNTATEKMRKKIADTDFKDPVVKIVSNVSAKPVLNSGEIKKLLVEQIEKPVRWRESIINMIGSGVNQFIEIGPWTYFYELINTRTDHVYNTFSPSYWFLNLFYKKFFNLTRV